MTAHAVYVCKVCPWVSAQVPTNAGNADVIAARQASAHVAVNPGHETVIHRVKMPWEIG